MPKQATHQTIFTGDNLDILRGFDSESVDLIYLDPPFNSKRHRGHPTFSLRAGTFKPAWFFEDTENVWWGWIADKYPDLYRAIEAARASGNEDDLPYLIFLTMRVLEMKRILKPSGSIYLHCTQATSHSFRMMMDGIFGPKNFRNEIIRVYGTDGASRRRFSRQHDTILFYSAGRDYTFNPPQEKGFLRDVWEIPPLSKKERMGYPFQKPLALLRRIILASSNEGDVVLDPFCGCATACLAAEDLGRKWIGIDISPLAAKIMQKRMKNELGLSRKIKNRIM